MTNEEIGPVPYARFKQVNDRLRAAEAELAQLRREQMQDRAAQYTGLPLELADRIEGDDLDACIADARRLAYQLGI